MKFLNILLEKTQWDDNTRDPEILKKLMHKEALADPEILKSFR